MKDPCAFFAQGFLRCLCGSESIIALGLLVSGFSAYWDTERGPTEYGLLASLSIHQGTLKDRTIDSNTPVPILFFLAPASAFPRERRGVENWTFLGSSENKINFRQEFSGSNPHTGSAFGQILLFSTSSQASGDHLWKTLWRNPDKTIAARFSSP